MLGSSEIDKAPYKHYTKSMSDLDLDFYDAFPEGFDQVTPENIRSVFPNPSIVHLRGKNPEPVFVSTLLHGNELTSFAVLQRLARHLKGQFLNRSVIFFVGNVWACEQKQRFLVGQRDYNRVWTGGDTPEHRLANRVKEWVLGQGPLFACVDIHNNTGLNPMYGCINRLEPKYKYLASLFSRTVVYFQNPSTALSIAMAEWAPSVTVECGQSLDPTGVEKAFRLVLDVIHHSSLEHKVNKQDIEVYHTVVQLKLGDQQEYSFLPNKAELSFSENFEHLNFTPLNPGFVFAHLNSDQLNMQSFDDDGNDRFGEFFTVEDNKLILKKRVIPSMLTTDKTVIQKDCLGYLMEEL